MIWVPEDHEPVSWLGRATALPLISDLPKEPADLPTNLFVLWPSAQCFVARAFAAGTMPSVALEHWSDHARGLSDLMDDRVVQITLIDHEAALSDPLLLLEEMGFDESLALHATDAPPAPTGLPALIAAEAVASDTDAAALDHKLGALAAGRDAPLDVDELAQGYAEAVLQGNFTAVDQLRDQLFHRQMQRSMSVVKPAPKDAAPPPLVLAAPTSSPSNIKPVSRADLARAVAEIHKMQRAMAAKDRNMARTQARVHRLEGMVAALTSQSTQPHTAEHPGSTATPPPPPHSGGPTYAQAAAPDMQPGANVPPQHQMYDQPAPVPGQDPYHPNMAPPPYAAYGTPVPSQPSAPPGYPPVENPAYAPPNAAPSAPPAPVQPGPAGFPGGNPAFQPLMQPYPPGHAAPQPPMTPHAPPHMPGYAHAPIPPVHAYATPENPLALPPQRSLQTLGPDHEPASPPRRGGLFSRLRGK